MFELKVFSPEPLNSSSSESSKKEAPPQNEKREYDKTVSALKGFFGSDEEVDRIFCALESKPLRSRVRQLSRNCGVPFRPFAMALAVSLACNEHMSVMATALHVRQKPSMRHTSIQKMLSLGAEAYRRTLN